jgi:hypothetical protein
MKILYAAQRMVFGIVGLAAVCASFYFAYKEVTESFIAFFIGGSVLFLLSNIDRFQSIKAPGIQATMREIDEKKREIEELAEKVAKTSVVTAEFCMEVMGRLGRASGPIPREISLHLIQNMSGQLLSLNVPQSRVDSLLSPWRNIVAYELISPARRELDHAILLIQQKADETLRALPKPINSNSDAFLECEQQRQEANEWRANVEDIWKLTGLERMQKLKEVYEGFIGRYGRSTITRPEIVEKAIQHGTYFVKNDDFLDVQYWLVDTTGRS